MNLLKNKWFILASCWFGAAIYGLIFRESAGNPAPPFPHFDKWAHALLFFVQFWLLARMWVAAKKDIPYKSLLCLALLMAVATEWAQAAFTHTRQADVWDGVADMVGASVALYLAHHAVRIWARPSAHKSSHHQAPNHE